MSKTLGNKTRGDVKIKITTVDSTRTLYDAEYAKFKEGFVPMDISAEPDGFYLIRVTTGESTVVRKIKVKHKD